MRQSARSSDDVFDHLGVFGRLYRKGQITERGIDQQTRALCSLDAPDIEFETAIGEFKALDEIGARTAQLTIKPL
jgi:hypothetical protein